MTSRPELAQRIADLEATTADLTATTDNHEDRITALEAQVADHEERLDALEDDGPPDPPPTEFEPDPFVLAQIARDEARTQTAFQINNSLINPGAAETALWTATYKFDLGNGFGWVPGDRAGYTSAYMFLADTDPLSEFFGRFSHRVFFTVPSAAGAYGKVNDKYMDEIQTTKIKFNGVGDSAASQSQSPGAFDEYDVLQDPTEVRPIIHLTLNGAVIEDRSYTNTVTPGIATMRFQDLGYTDTPQTVVNGLGLDPHTVYERQSVAAYVPRPDGWNPSHTIYYDALIPNAGFTQ